MSNLGDYLKQSRNEQNLSLAEVYRQTGITNSRLCKAENGSDKTLAPLEIKKLSLLYGVAVIPMYIMAGYLDTSDLEEYRSGFKNTELLDQEEREHIQDQIDFIIRKKG